MKILKFLIILFIINNCSLNKDSQYWNESSTKNEIVKKNSNKATIMNKNIMEMTFDEYKNLIKTETKKSKYPDISQ